MRVLYVASAVEVGGASGGSTHVAEVACGLRKLGHDVLVISRIHSKVIDKQMLDCDVPVVPVLWPSAAALLALPQISMAFRTFKPDVLMERFYNFAGGGLIEANKRSVPSLLEVNAPMIDPPGSFKTRLDRLLLGSMRRWAVRQGRWSAAIVTPLATTVPPEVDYKKIHELPWGANVQTFKPELRSNNPDRLRAIRARLGLADTGPIAIFLGSFRAWHGVSDFARAARTLIEAGTSLSFLAIGGGPELHPIKEDVEGWDLPPGRLIFAGSQPHERVPELLALGEIGVAPFDLSAHAPLRQFGFYWSPLKVFEYMSMALPVVTIDVPPLNTIVRDAQEGLLYRPGDIDGLVSRLRELESAPELRQKLGNRARERVVSLYSWESHCLSLENLLRAISGGV